MKQARDDKNIDTIPYGAYEAGTTDTPQHPPKDRYKNELATDIQGNGYPSHMQREKVN